MSTLRFGALEVDLNERRLHAPAGVHRLTQLEVKLLSFLAAHRGRTVSRRQLLDEVWGARAETRAVDHTVHRLRKKLEPDPSQPRWLTSTRGGGYRLESEPTELAALPEEPSSFVGRLEELERVRAGLQDSPTVLVLGLGGVGKSRLALRAAMQWREEGGETLVIGLRNARSGAEVRTMVAGALGVQTAHLRDALVERPDLLLVLDEVEQLQDVDLELAGWAGPRFLLTSQRRVGSLPALELGPLSLPEAAALVAARCPVPVTPTDAERLASALDGVPFALEIGARWLAVAPVEQVLARLDQLREHPAVSAALVGSWEILSQEPRALLGDAALFAGPFALSDLEQLSGCPRALELSADLVARGWLHRAGERLVMYTVVRQFLQTRGAIPEDGALRHVHWLLSWAPEARLALTKAWDAAREERLTAAQPELALALSRVEDPELAAPLLSARYRRFGVEVTPQSAALAEVDGWLARLDPGSRRVAELCLLRANMSLIAGDHASARRMVAQGRAALGAAAPGDGQLEASLDAALASALLGPEELAEAEALLQRARLRFEEVGAPQNLGIVYMKLAQLLARRDREAAHAALLEALRLQTEVGNLNSLLAVHSNLAHMSVSLGRAEAARSHHERAVALCRQLQDRSALARLLSNQANDLLMEGELVGARAAVEESCHLWRRLGARRGWAIASMVLGWIELEEGHEASALELALAAREELARTEPRHFWALVEALLGQASLALGRAEQARAFFEQAVEAARRGGFPPDEGLAGIALSQLAAGERESSQRLAADLRGRSAEIVEAALADREIPDRSPERFEVRALVRAARRLVSSPIASTLIFERGAGSQVRLQLQHGERLVDLGHRRPWQVLWVLALKRQRDAALPEHEQGWLQVEDLAHRADMELRQVDTYISRARVTLAEAGLPQAADIVVSRRGERRLGLALDRLSLRGQHRPGAGPPS
jgi:DNA-binding winged helix-turn-helix (wHTH) protein/tetratricopeptide (TPR) repeat protein